MLDKLHGFPIKRDHGSEPMRLIGEQNVYEFGSIGDHNVVVAIMPEVGNNVAAIVATRLLNDFPAVRFGLLVGIGGAVPDDDVDIRLGDVVVSQPSEQHGGVIQYDLGRQLADGRYQRIGQLNKPPQVLSANVQRLRAHHRMAGHRLADHLTDMLARWPYMETEYSYPASAPDRLFEARYKHQSGRTCMQCDAGKAVTRSQRSSHESRIHYGNIGSANIVVKDPVVRDSLKKDGLNILCVEMEAAGLMDSFPSLVIRGIADYADSHKNDQWQPYAAAAAAAYMKELLLIIPAAEVLKENKAEAAATLPGISDKSHNTSVGAIAAHSQRVDDQLHHRQPFDGSGPAYEASSNQPNYSAQSPVKRSILIIQCEDSYYHESEDEKWDRGPMEDFAFNLRDACTIIEANNVDEAWAVLQRPPPELLAVYFYEYDYRGREERGDRVHAKLAEAVLEFMRNGGMTIIYGPNADHYYERFLKYGCRLKWRRSVSSSGDPFILNEKFSTRALALPKGLPKRHTPSQMTTVENAKPEELIYLNERGEVRETEGIHAIARVGEGYVAWYGEMAIKEASQQIFFAMVGLEWKDE